MQPKPLTLSNIRQRDEQSQYPLHCRNRHEQRPIRNSHSDDCRSSRGYSHLPGAKERHHWHSDGCQRTHSVNHDGARWSGNYDAGPLCGKQVGSDTRRHLSRHIGRSATKTCLQNHTSSEAAELLQSQKSRQSGAAPVAAAFTRTAYDTQATRRPPAVLRLLCPESSAGRVIGKVRFPRHKGVTRAA